MCGRWAWPSTLLPLLLGCDCAATLALVDAPLALLDALTLPVLPPAANAVVGIAEVDADAATAGGMAPARIGNTELGTPTATVMAEGARWTRGEPAAALDALDASLTVLVGGCSGETMDGEVLTSAHSAPGGLQAVGIGRTTKAPGHKHTEVKSTSDKAPRRPSCESKLAPTAAGRSVDGHVAGEGGHDTSADDDEMCGSGLGPSVCSDPNPSTARTVAEWPGASHVSGLGR